MAVDAQDEDGFRAIDPEAKSKLVNERIQGKLGSESEGGKGLLGALLQKFETFKRFMRLDFLKRKGKKGAENHMLDTDAYRTIQGETLMGRPEIDKVLEASAQKKFELPKAA